MLVAPPDAGVAAHGYPRDDACDAAARGARLPALRDLPPAALMLSCPAGVHRARPAPCADSLARALPRRVLRLATVLCGGSRQLRKCAELDVG